MAAANLAAFFDGVKKAVLEELKDYTAALRVTADALDGIDKVIAEVREESASDIAEAMADEREPDFEDYAIRRAELIEEMQSIIAAIVITDEATAIMRDRANA